MPIFQTAYVRKVRHTARPGLSCQPLGNLAAEKADRPKALAWRGGILPEERTLKNTLEAGRRPPRIGSNLVVLSLQFI
jgi:hypothetical protein